MKEAVLFLLLGLIIGSFLSGLAFLRYDVGRGPYLNMIHARALGPATLNKCTKCHGTEWQCDACHYGKRN